MLFILVISECFKDAKTHCNHLTVALHEDPSMARPHKLKPVQTVEERRETTTCS